uniref:Uncharacterized protein n=1 Tax=Setaria viridis TaxID=4556 RepID=A0A4U6UYL3_SETVI|nr:LOW QUALITY PROTEIN: hypothetical protein SEVIR_4G089900v2 [Setaria viridis]
MEINEAFIFPPSCKALGRLHALRASVPPCLHKCLALRGRRVPQRREQVLPPAQPDGVVARAGGRVREQLPGVPGVGPAPEDPGARRGGLEPGAGVALVVPVPVGIGDRAGEERGEADDHAVDADVAVGRHERRRLGPVRRLVERPRALAGALPRRIPRPQVRVPRPAVRAGEVAAVGAAPRHAEGYHGDVGGREHGRDGAPVVPRGARQRCHVARRKRARAQRHALVEDLPAERHPRAAAARGGPPPRRHGRSGGGPVPGRCSSREGADEVGDDRALRRGEAPVEEQVDGEVPREQRAAVVPQHDRVGLHQEQHARVERRAPRRRRSAQHDGGEDEADQQRLERLLLAPAAHGSCCARRSRSMRC